MNNVKIMHTKETIMTNNYFTEGVTQKQSNGRCSRGTQYTTLTCEFSQSQEAIILKSHIFIGALHKFHHIPSEYRPLGIPRDKNSDVYNMLDVLKNPLFFLMDKMLTSPKTSSSSISEKRT